MTAELGLLVPLTHDPFAAGEQEAVEAALTAGHVDGVWVRDLPCVPRDDADVGQAADPFAHLGFLAGRSLPFRTLGTASIILGTRHPVVIARAAAGLQHLTGGRFVLGVGTGGKPAMNRALGVDDRPLHDFVRDWRTLRSVLQRLDTWEPAVVVPTAPGRPPPAVFLATTDLAKWRAIDGDADGWQTFVTTPSHFLETYAEVCAVRGGPTDVAVRLDATVVPSEAAPMTPNVGARGRVACSSGQLTRLVDEWRQLPVRHLLLRLRSPAPLAVLRSLHEVSVATDGSAVTAGRHRTQPSR